MLYLVPAPGNPSQDPILVGGSIDTVQSFGYKRNDVSLNNNPGVYVMTIRACNIGDPIRGGFYFFNSISWMGRPSTAPLEPAAES